MNRVVRNFGAVVTAVVWAMVGADQSAGAVVTFEDLSLPADTAETGAGLTPYGSGIQFGETENWNRFASSGVTFENRTIPAFGSWSQWAYSSRTDKTTAGFSSGTSAFSGGGANGSAHYGISFGETNRLELPDGLRSPQSVMVTNTTYTALSMRNGDAFAKQFGGTDGTDPDFFALEILGEGAGGAITGSVRFFLADYRAADDILVDTWETMDLTHLGSDVHALQFRLESSDNGAFGMNTPAYFAMDNLHVVPEPSSAVMFLGAGGFLVFFRRRFRSQ